MVSARPCRDNTLWQRSRKRAPPKFVASRLFVLGNQTEQAVLFVRYSGGEINPGAERQKIPKPIELQRRSIGAQQRFDKSARNGIVIVDRAVTEIATPKFAIDQSKSPWGVEIAV